MTDQEYTGGSVSYYTCSVTHPISDTADPYDAECIDIIDALEMTPNEGNAFKALWRRAAARLGKSKRGYTDGLYDAEKVEFYGKRLVELERRERRIEEAIESLTRPDFAGAFKEGLRNAEAEQEKKEDPIVQYYVDKVLAGEMNFLEAFKGAVGAAVITKTIQPEPPHASDPFGPRDADGWYTWNGDDTMRPAGLVDIIDKEGEWSKGSMDAGTVRWNHNGSAGDIVKWRPA